MLQITFKIHTEINNFRNMLFKLSYNQLGIACFRSIKLVSFPNPNLHKSK